MKECRKAWRENKKKDRKKKSVPVVYSLLLIPYWVNLGQNVSAAYQMLWGYIRKIMTAKAIRDQTKYG